MRDQGTPSASGRASNHSAAKRVALVEGVVIGISDGAGGIPVKPARCELEWRSWGDADEAAGGIELVEQRRQVELVGPAAMKENDRALGLATRRAELMGEQREFVAHAFATPARGFARGVSDRSRWLRNCSYCGGRRSASPRCSGSSSTANPGLGVASSNRTPRGSRK